jgi:hypothetical protein
MNECVSKGKYCISNIESESGQERPSGKALILESLFQKCLVKELKLMDGNRVHNYFSYLSHFLGYCATEVENLGECSASIYDKVSDLSRDSSPSIDDLIGQGQ